MLKLLTAQRNLFLKEIQLNEYCKCVCQVYVIHESLYSTYNIDHVLIIVYLITKHKQQIRSHFNYGFKI